MGMSSWHSHAWRVRTLWLRGFSHGLTRRRYEGGQLNSNFYSIEMRSYNLQNKRAMTEKEIERKEGSNRIRSRDSIRSEGMAKLNLARGGAANVVQQHFPSDFLFCHFSTRRIRPFPAMCAVHIPTSAANAHAHSLGAIDLSGSYDLVRDPAQIDANGALSNDLARFLHNAAVPSSAKSGAAPAVGHPRYAVRWMPQVYALAPGMPLPAGEHRLAQGAFVSPSTVQNTPEQAELTSSSASTSPSPVPSMASFVDPSLIYSPLSLPPPALSGDHDDDIQQYMGTPELGLDGVMTEHDALFGGNMSGSNVLYPAPLGLNSSPYSAISAGFVTGTVPSIDGLSEPSPFVLGTTGTEVLGAGGFLMSANPGDFGGIIPSMAQAPAIPADAAQGMFLGEKIQRQGAHPVQLLQQQQQQQSPVSPTPDLVPSHLEESSDTASDTEAEAEVKAHSDDEYVPSPPPSTRSGRNSTSGAGRKRRATTSSSGGQGKKGKTLSSGNSKTIPCPYKGANQSLCDSANFAANTFRWPQVVTICSIASTI
jgi:hypothetical protein